MANTETVEAILFSCIQLVRDVSNKKDFIVAPFCLHLTVFDENGSGDSKKYNETRVYVDLNVPRNERF